MWTQVPSAGRGSQSNDRTQSAGAAPRAAVAAPGRLGIATNAPCKRWICAWMWRSLSRAAEGRNTMTTRIDALMTEPGGRPLGRPKNATPTCTASSPVSQRQGDSRPTGWLRIATCSWSPATTRRRYDGRPSRRSRIATSSHQPPGTRASTWRSLLGAAGDRNTVQTRGNLNDQLASGSARRSGRGSQRRIMLRLAA